MAERRSGQKSCASRQRRQIFVQHPSQARRDAAQRQATLGRGDEAGAPETIFDRHRIRFLKEFRQDGAPAASTMRAPRDDRWRPSVQEIFTKRSVAMWHDARMPPSQPLASMVKNGASSPVRTEKPCGLLGNEGRAIARCRPNCPSRRQCWRVRRRGIACRFAD